MALCFAQSKKQTKKKTYAKTYLTLMATYYKIKKKKKESYHCEWNVGKQKFLPGEQEYNTLTFF